jgi:hypothetical protein
MMSVQNVDTVPAAEVTAGTGTKCQVLIGPEQGPNFAMRRFIIRTRSSTNSMFCVEAHAFKSVTMCIV